MSVAIRCSECQFVSPPGSRRCKRCHFPFDGVWPSLVTKNVGTYQLVRRIGGGGFGGVYEARHTTLGHPVAAKVMHPQLSRDPQWLERFQREAYVLAELRHENVVQVRDFGSEDDVGFYLIMEWLHGHSLSRVRRQHPRPEWGWLFTVFSQLLDALEYAHQRGIVHRDLKPDNLLITWGSREHLVLKIVDFGIATLIESTQPQQEDHTRRPSRQSHVVVGTCYYMAPEQVKGEIDRMGPHTDLYACGILLAELLTGRRVFQGRNQVETMRLQVEAKPPRLIDLDPQGFFPDSLEQLVQRSLAKNIEDRYRSASEFFQDLKQAFESAGVEPIQRDIYRPHHPTSSGVSLYRPLTRDLLDASPTPIPEEEAEEHKTSPASLPSERKTPSPLSSSAAHPLYKPPPPSRRLKLWHVLLAIVLFLGGIGYYTYCAGPSRRTAQTGTNKQTDKRPITRTKSAPTQPPVVVKPAPHAPQQRPQQRRDPAPPKRPEARPSTPPKTTAIDRSSDAMGKPSQRLIRSSVTARQPALFRQAPAQREDEQNVEKVSLRLRSSPPQCDVYLNGKRQGKTPITLELAKGQRAILEFKKSGYVTRKIIIRPQAPTRWKIRLIEDLFE